MRLTETLPEAKEKIESGELSLSNAAQLQVFIRQEEKVVDLSQEQKQELLHAIEGKSFREAERELLQTLR